MIGIPSSTPFPVFSLPYLQATPEDGGIDGGSEIGIIVKDVDFVQMHHEIAAEVVVYI